jgi:hypothetical protein
MGYDIMQLGRYLPDFSYFSNNTTWGPVFDKEEEYKPSISEDQIEIHTTKFVLKAYNFHLTQFSVVTTFNETIKVVSNFTENISTTPTAHL